MQATIIIKFVDFWAGFDEQNNIFVETLRRQYDVEVLSDDKGDEPQLLIYSAFGSEHFKYNCIKLYYTGENDVPNFNQCDYAISAQVLQFGTRHMRMPQYLLYKEYGMIQEVHKNVPEDAFNRDFCSVVVSNSTYAAPERIEIIDAIEQYKRLTYGGAFRNNVGGRVPDKMAFIKRFKFNIALENSLVDGYTTEKLVEPMAASTVPIYWGNRMVDKEFNPEAYINVADYDTYDSAVRAIERIDNDPEAYMAMLAAPKILTDAIVDWRSMLLDFLNEIISNGCKYVVPYGILGHQQYVQQRKEVLYSNVLLRKCAGAWVKLIKDKK